MRLKFDDCIDESEYTWEVHFIIPRGIERIEMDYTINPIEINTVDNSINQVGG